MKNYLALALVSSEEQEHGFSLDKHLYKARHLVENAFLRLKEWRGVATRYAKRADTFLSIVQIRCMIYWLRVICGARNE